MSELKPVGQYDFSGGENSSVNPYLLQKNQSQRINNMMLTETGSLRTRDGTSVVYNGNSVLTSTEIDRVGVYNQYGSFGLTAIPVAVLLHKVYDLRTTPWTLIGTMSADPSSTIYPLQLVNFVNKILISHGAFSAPYSWDGTTFSALTDTGAANNLIPQMAAIMINYNGYVYLMNTGLNNTTYAAHGATANIGPSSINSSDFNNPNSWPTSAQLYLNEYDGQKITGAGVFTVAETGIAPSQVLIVFKDFGTYQVTGLINGGSPQAIQVKTDMGCSGHSTIQFIAGYGMIRLTHKGFGLYDGLNDTVISDSIRFRIFNGFGSAGIDFTQAYTAQSTQIQNPPTYICAVSMNGDALGLLSTVFICDLRTMAWTVNTFANAIYSLSRLESPSTLPVIVGGDYVISGFAQIRRMFASDATDDGTAVSWSVTPQPAFAQTPIDRAYFRRALVDIVATGTPAQITAQFFYGATSKTINKTPQNRTQDSVIPFDLGFIANNAYPTISGTGPVTLRGLEYHLIQKPMTRSTIAVGDN